MIETLAAIFSSGGLGAIVGTVGSLFTRAEERKKQKHDNDFQIRMAEINLDESKLDREHEVLMADKNRKHAALEGQIANDISSSDSFKQSIISGRMQSGIRIIDGIRALMRPVITLYLLAASTILAVNISYLVGGLESLEPDKLFELYNGVISDLSFLTMTAVAWWFGTRKINK